MFHKTIQGLTIQAELDQGSYPTGIKVTDGQLSAVNLISGYFGEEEHRRAGDLGINEYLSKPVSSRELLRVIGTDDRHPRA